MSLLPLKPFYRIGNDSVEKSLSTPICSVITQAHDTPNLSFIRISVIFRVRSAKAVKITDASLIKKVGILCGFVSVALLIRTLVSPPDVIVGRTADNLKAFLCKTDWWDHTFTSRKCIDSGRNSITQVYWIFLLTLFFTVEVLFLAWGVRLCIVVRKAPSEFNESRFISMAIYNEFLLTCFLNVSM